MRLSATNARPQRAAASFAPSPSPPQPSNVRCRPRRSSIPLSRRAASHRAPFASNVVTLSTSSPSAKGATRREIRAAAAPETEPSAPSRRLELVGALPADASLDERISSGEFTDAGSTKERASRPVRKFLAKDPVGPGERIRRREFLGLERARERRNWRVWFFSKRRLVFFIRLARKKIRVGGGEEEERASVTLRFSDRREGDAGEEGR